MTHQYKFNKNDEFYTPAYAVVPIVNYLPAGSKIWCPFDKEESQFVKLLKKRGYEVIFTHIEDGEDFFYTKIPECDYIVSNPPYSIKNEVFLHLYDIGKPFAMLLNFQGLFDNKIRANLFSNNKIEILYLSPRVAYVNPMREEVRSSPPFQSAYICSNILPKQIMFTKVDKSLKNL